MLLGQAAVLVQIDGRDLGEVDIALVVPLDQLLVGATGVPPVAKTQYTVRFMMTCAEMMFGALRDIS